MSTMGKLADYQYVALKRMKIGEDFLESGDMVPVEASQGFKNLRTLISAGWITPIGPIDGRRRRKSVTVKESEERTVPDDVDVHGKSTELGPGRPKADNR